MAGINLGDLVVSTARQYIDNIADNVTNNNALLVRLKSKGQIKKKSGGRTIVEPLIYGTNSSVQFYQDYDTFTPPTTGQAVFDGAEYQWKQCGGFLAWTGREERMNMGEQENFDIVETRIKQLQAQLNNTIGASIFSDGTGGAGKELTGLKVLIADNPASAGTVGGIDQVANTFWRNQFIPASTINPQVTATTVTGYMNTAWLSTIRNKDKPDLVVADTIFFNAYWSSLQSIQRITRESDVQDAGYQSLAFMDADVVYDVNCASKHMYFIDTDAIYFRTASDRSAGFDVGDSRQIVNADYKVVPVWFMGNLTCNRRSGCSVLIST
jgi:hypothetical protein